MQENWTLCPSVHSQKSTVDVLNETDYSGDEYSSDEEGADRDLQLLDVASLEIAPNAPY